MLIIEINISTISTVFIFIRLVMINTLKLLLRFLKIICKAILIIKIIKKRKNDLKNRKCFINFNCFNYFIDFENDFDFQMIKNDLFCLIKFWFWF